MNSSELRRDVDRFLRQELGHIHVGVPGFRETYFGSMEGLEVAAQTVFRKCEEGDDPPYDSERMERLAS